MKTTRRGFMRGTVVGAAGLGACVEHPHSQGSDHPSGQPAMEGAAKGHLVQLRTTVNGAAETLEVGPDESSLSVVRERLGLTGAKLGCGHGACGACAIQVDGQPVASCLLPALKLEGRQVETVEHLATDDELHPIQRAFMAEDAMQCGYCTPGFVVEAAAFHDAWRARRGTASPSRDEVAKALSGHLCRCGTYAAIYRAVIGACEGRFDAAPEAGAPLVAAGPRVDGLAKVTGAAKYTVDVRPEGMLEAQVLRSPHAHARVRAIDWSRALALPGVHGAVRMTEIGHKVRFVGQEVVALAAADIATARAALREVEVDYEVLEAVVGTEAALAEGAPEIYVNRTHKRAPNENELDLFPVRWKANLRGPFGMFARQAGRAARRIEDDAEAFSGTFETQTQVHTALEPHAAVAEWIGDDSLRVHLSTQAVSHMAEELAKRFGLRRDAVEVHAEFVGGGFGAKAVMPIEALMAVELARVCGRPVRVANDRREELIVGGLRPALRAEVQLSVPPSDGGNTPPADGEAPQPALRMHTWADAGVAIGSAAAAMARIHLPQAQLDLADYDVITNGPPGTPFRGPGGPPAFFAMEQAIDAHANALGRDPVALRRGWNRNPARARVYEWIQEQALWRDRPAPLADRGRYRRGIGVATATWPYFVEPATQVTVAASSAGFRVSMAGQDIGTGTRTLLAEAVAAVLGVPVHTIEAEIGDSSRGTHGPTAGGSRTAASVFPAATRAAEALRDELLEVAEARLQLDAPVAVPGGLEGRPRGDGAAQPQFVPWSEVLAVAPAITTTGKRKRDQGGYFLPPVAGLAIGRHLGAGAQITELEVDTRLGRVRVLRAVAGLSIGKVHSPTLARSQVEGGMIQGLSFALYEERRLDPRDGTLLTGGLEDYRVCGLGDVGALEVHFIPGGFEGVQGRGIGLGELCTLPPAASIANAVAHATGWRPTQIPLRPDRVLAGLASVAQSTEGSQP